MRPHVTFLLLALLTAFGPMRLTGQDAVSQQPDLEQTLTSLQHDLDQLSQSISTYDDIELYDYEFQTAGNRVKSLAITIGKEDPLYDRFDACNREFYQIQKRIEGLKEEHERQQSYDALMDRFQKTLQQLSDYKTLGEQYVDSHQPDSLMIVKKKAGNTYNKASVEASTQRELVNNDAALGQLWDEIEAYNADIEALECANKGKMYEMLFRIVMVVAAFLMIFNMLQSKIKAKKMAKTAQKQMQNFMGNSDTPVLIFIFVLMFAFLPSMKAQDLVLDYPRLSKELDTIFVDFKLMENHQKMNVGTVNKSAITLEEVGYNGNEEITLADVLDIRNYDPDYASGNYSMVVLVDRSVSVEQLEAQRAALTELFQGFPKAHFYVTAMDAGRTPTATVQNSYQLISWMDSCFSVPSTDQKFIYKAMASVIEEISGEAHDFYPEVPYNANLADNTKKTLMVLTDGTYMNGNGEYIGGEEFFRIKMSLINSRTEDNPLQVVFIYFGDDFKRDDFQKEVQYVSGANDRFFPKYDFKALKEYLVMRPDPTAMDYRMVILNPTRKLYDGQKITLHAYYEENGKEAYGFRNFTMGSLLHPMAVKVDKADIMGLWIRCIATGLIIILLLYLVFRIIVPRAKNWMFKQRYVKTFIRANTLPTRARDYVGQKCYYCKDSFAPGDRVVTKCEHTMHYDCWKENGHQCPEYGKTCDEGRFFYNEDHPWDKRNAPFYLKSMLIGAFVGLIAWMVFRGTTVNTLFFPLIADLVALSGKVGIDSSGMAFVDKIHDLLFFCVVVGFFVTLCASWLVEHRKKTTTRVLIILLRAFLGALAGFLAGLIGALVAMATGKDYNCFIVDIIPWLLMGLLVGFVVSYKTHVSVKRAVTWGFFFAFVSFCVLYLFSFEGSDFEFQHIGLLASILCMLAVMLYSGGFCAFMATPDRVSDHYFLQVEGTPKTRDVAIYKWMNRIGGYRVVTIGRSARCYIDMDWDDSPGIDGVQAEVYVENDKPYYRNLATNQAKPLKHGTSFVVGRTRFTYLEKDCI